MFALGTGIQIAPCSSVICMFLLCFIEPRKLTKVFLCYYVIGNRRILFVVELAQRGQFLVDSNSGNPAHVFLMSCHALVLRRYIALSMSERFSMSERLLMHLYLQYSRN